MTNRDMKHNNVISHSKFSYLCQQKVVRSQQHVRQTTSNKISSRLQKNEKMGFSKENILYL